jgi:hypothetical protein
MGTADIPEDVFLKTFTVGCPVADIAGQTYGLGRSEAGHERYPVRSRKTDRVGASLYLVE